MTIFKRVLKVIFYLTVSGLSLIICLIGFVMWQEASFEETTINNIQSEADGGLRDCSAHGITLQIDRVYIRYGLMLSEPNDKELFPYSNKWVGGGCLGNSPRHALVLYCYECRKAQSEGERKMKDEYDASIRNGDWK